MMHLAVEASPNGMVMTDCDGKIVMVNSATEKLFGYSRQELIGHSIEVLIPARFRHHHPGYRQAYISESKSRSMGHGRDLYGLHKSGKEFPVEVGLNPVETEHDGIFVLAAIVDITDRKHAEEMIHLAVEASPNGMVMTNHEGKIMMVNTTTEALFGYQREELLGQSIEVLIPESHRAHHPALRSDFIKHPSTRAMGHGRDLHGQHKNGKEFPVEVGLNPIQTPRGVMVLASVIDITERKSQEEQLKAALKEKDLLLSEIHHRVKNNLQIIDSLLGMQSDMLNNSAAISVLKESQNRVKSMALIHQVLYQSLDFSRTDFSSFIQSLVDNLSVSYALDASRIVVNIDTDQEVLLPIDVSIPLGLILNELCTNAMKYAFTESRCGHIDISLKRQNPEQLLVCISDDGVGIPDDFDIENTQSLGLQLVQLLSEQISAELTIQRKNPTRFSLIVPL
ncbi:MAG: PAS domain S-box protein [Nitrosomonas sp.]|uniref:sensor histidine kinase n=1 Tax=Nitrosomonas sp. TaxID=42353 RepID=UPI0025DAC973|nr:PAS domain S-box protein [Nitrosomonas sp.]UJP00846.1 MAG: PAS domain S-box protein [Nitrosomonas sp.]UJP01749.1 MAG: PAS domain S-box protein [Nitrosomonas sp.]UJP08365.1 MAG: PAS domain S-box protein [Nitrosomonas sp.]